MYQKEVIYLHLFDGEIKGNCVGYLKAEKKEGQYALELQVRNFPQGITGSFPIRLQSENGWQEPDALTVKEGDGKWTGTLAEAPLRAEVIISPASKIKGEGRNCKIKDKPRDITPPVVEPEIPDKEKGAIHENKAIRENRAIIAAEKTDPPTTLIREEHSKAERTSQTGQMPLYENKWEQLMSTYEQIHPYGDDRVYVKLEPKDFVILRENYQHLVNNSFLLHGFYNYRYLILGKESGFYLGVPGVFYEREKMVALMFGFEAFECEGGEAEEGKFGYYLRKVEL
ncbi:MAG: hypothetical protein NC314_11740 [Roseburia sp.]|nr:hypothetical protein [Roseburia sp.]MCM1243503.1 hypothetical protein [Roseburia sp.]